MSLRIIVNADDLGISEQVNEAILSRLERRQISSATLIANAPAIEEAARAAKRFPHGTFGVHLNATEFEPLTCNPALRPLLDEDGNFAGNIRKVRLDRRVRAAVQQEWVAQIERLQQLGVHVSHIDSHHHVHTIPALFGPLKAVQKHFGIRQVRTTMNLYARDSAVSSVLRARKQLWAQALRNLYRTRTTRWFTAFATFHARLHEFTGGAATFEVMTHPGHDAFIEETALLDTEWKHAPGSHIDLIRYTDL